MDKYFCEQCKYGTNLLPNYIRHCETKKHKHMIENKIEIIEKIIDNKPVYICEYCKKEYTKSGSLWYHVKKCKIQYDKFMEKTGETLEKKKNEEIEEFKHEIKQEIKEEFIKMNDKIENQEIINKSLNDKIDKVKPIVFNLHFFLNEQCKGAISLDELLQQIQFHFDPAKTLTEDTSNTLLKTLTTMGLYERPIHCVDLKRNKLVIKDNNEWTKDMTVFNKVPKYAYNSYKNHVNEWTEENPDFLENGDTSDIYITYIAKEAQDIDTSKIMRNISKVITIPKQELKE